MSDNGKKEIHVDETWMIVRDGTSAYLGKPVGETLLDKIPETPNPVQPHEDWEDDGTVTLCPAYHLLTEIVRDGSGKSQGLAQICLPLEHLYTADAEVTVRWSSIVELSTASKEDRQRLAQLVVGAEKVRLNNRAKASGLTLASP